MSSDSDPLDDLTSAIRRHIEACNKARLTIGPNDALDAVLNSSDALADALEAVRERRAEVGSALVHLTGEQTRWLRDELRASIRVCTTAHDIYRKLNKAVAAEARRILGWEWPPKSGGAA